MDLSYFCMNIGHLMGLPVRVYKGNKLFCSYNNVEFIPDTVELIIDEILSNPHSVDYYDSAKPLFFGSIKTKNNKTTIIIGPTFSIKPKNEQLQILLRELGISFDRFNEFKYYIENIPTYSIETFVQIICFINYYVNNEKVSVSDLLIQDYLSQQSEPHVTQEPIENTDEVKIHNTYNMEKLLLSYITTGNTDALKKMFEAPPTGRVGKIAHDELRQKKNTFICSATLASRAAIDGGLSHEIAFTLSDYYIQKVEMLSDFNAITKLNIDMLLEFSEDVEELKVKGSHSKYVIDIVRYINKNLNRKIALEDISSNIGISRTYLCNIFKTELGTTVNAFITDMKIEEAKRLLRLTDKPISNISEFLNFSSQSYFQNIFKKSVGVTPN